MTTKTALLMRTVKARRALPDPSRRRELRELAGLSQEDVAAALGVTRQAVARWENGSRFPRSQHLIAYTRLLRALGAGE